MFDTYKKFRNRVAKFGMHSGFTAIWEASRDIERLSSSRAHYPLGLPVGSLLPWQLELIAREMLLSKAIGRPDRETSTSDLRLAARDLERLHERISSLNIHSTDEALDALIPLQHQQHGWSEADWHALQRYARIYGHSAIQSVAESRLGISLHDLYVIGIAVCGGLLNAPGVLRSTYALTPHIQPGADQNFFQWMSRDIDTLEKMARARLRLDRTWAFTFNPLREFPLVFRPSDPDRLYAPLPRLLMWRLSGGLYYELIKDRYFRDVGLGIAFESYVGEVLGECLGGSTVSFERATPYSEVKARRKHGTDWIVRDVTGCLFVETKAKRLVAEARESPEADAFTKDLRELARYIVQNYKNIKDARIGLSSVRVDPGLPIFNVVITMEPWHLTTHTLETRLNSMVREEALAAELPLALLDEVGFSVLSARELERVAQDVSRLGVKRVFESFGDYPRGPYRGLFKNNFGQLLPEYLTGNWAEQLNVSPRGPLPW